MANKTCTKCGKPKPEDKFAFRNKEEGKRRGTCKDCHAEYLREHYRDNREMYLKNARKQNDKLINRTTENIMEHLQEHPCVDCGENDPIVLEFDHVKGKKFKEVSGMVGIYCWARVKKEIDKCDVRCANCHKRKTAKERHWRKAQIMAYGEIGYHG